jgi:hypothetical protein
MYRFTDEEWNYDQPEPRRRPTRTVNMTATFTRPKPSLGQRILAVYCKCLWAVIRTFWTAVAVGVLIAIFSFLIMVMQAAIGA